MIAVRARISHPCPVILQSILGRSVHVVSEQKYEADDFDRSDSWLASGIAYAGRVEHRDSLDTPGTDRRLTDDLKVKQGDGIRFQGVHPCQMLFRKEPLLRVHRRTACNTQTLTVHPC